MAKDVMKLNDKINPDDKIVGSAAPKKIEPMRIETPQNKVLRTKIIGLDTLTGDKLFETENQIVSSIYAVCFLTETGGFFCCQKIART